MPYNSTSNRLINEKSPYLLQHAHNPVDWFSWSDEAFTKAKQEDKPIFLSIGYSTCHWCHVMEKESFEDGEIADLLNKNYISIKVDREERPDIDHIYMNVCRAMTGQGGWPLTIIMTPDKKPFLAGTYFPKESKWGRIGLKELLPKVIDKWENEREEIVDTSNKVVDYINPKLNVFKTGTIDHEMIEQGYHQFANQFDEQYGGFGKEPKFPTPHNLMFLMRYWKKTNDKHALEMVKKTLIAMHSGGMYDHVGFGFARYSTDREWLVPHFEKMLYDNALLAYTYLEAYQITQDKYFARVAEEILTYVLRDMQHPDGGFYSAEDADSEGVEGKFYIWSKEEILTILGKEDGELYSEIYDITESGNFDGYNIPNLIHSSISQIAEKYRITESELRDKIEALRVKLFNVREKRVHPYKDDKILTAWNGLMIAALGKAAQVLQDRKYSEAAAKTIKFIFTNLKSKDGRLLARYRDGEAKFNGYLDDYAFLMWGLIEQYEATFDPSYLEQSIELHHQMKEYFWDKENGGFFFSGNDAEDLIARPKEIYDGAMPSGNSVAALNILKLARLTSDFQMEDNAMAHINTFIGTISEMPRAYAYFLMAVQFVIGPTKEVVITSESENDESDNMLKLIQTGFYPEMVLIYKNNKWESDLVGIAPFTKEQVSIQGKATAYVCENFACQAPTTSLDSLLKMLQSK